MKRAEAIKQGFKIDDTCYPHVAYKGPRFKPDEIYSVPTEIEEDFENAKELLKQCLGSINPTSALASRIEKLLSK